MVVSGLLMILTGFVFWWFFPLESFTLPVVATLLLAGLAAATKQSTSRLFIVGVSALVIALSFAMRYAVMVAHR